MLPPTKLHHHRLTSSQDNLLTRFVTHTHASPHTRKGEFIVSQFNKVQARQKQKTNRNRDQSSPCLPKNSTPSVLWVSTPCSSRRCSLFKDSFYFPFRSFLAPSIVLFTTSNASFALPGSHVKFPAHKKWAFTPARFHSM